MKNITRYLLAMSLLLFWSSLSADGVIKNGAKLKLKKGTHLIEKGSVHILPNSSFIIEGMATIDEELSNQNGYQGIIIKSDAENTGSLIYNEGSPEAQVELYMTTKSSHLIGVPVSGEISGTLNFFGSPQTWLYEYNDGSGLSVINGNNDILNSGQGYYYRIRPYENPGITPIFEGNLKSSDLELDHASIPPIQFNSRGINLVSNPYACAIDWDDDNISLTNMEHSIWVYDSRKRRYKFRNTSGYGNLTNGIIPMGQGFFVRAKNNNASIIIPKEARLHNEIPLYKSSNEINSELSFVSLEVQQDTLSDLIWVGYQWDSSDDFDNGIDISKMFTFEEEPQLYTTHNEEEFCVDVIAEPIEDGKTVELHFRVGLSGTHHLEMQMWQGFEYMNVLLEDLVTGDVLDIKEMNTYEFEATVGDSDARFLLHFNPYTPTSVQDMNSSQVNMYAYQKTIYINSDGKFAKQSKNILIYDVNGKQLGEVFLPAGKMQKIENIYQRKVLILKAIYPEQIFTRKILNF